MTNRSVHEGRGDSIMVLNGLRSALSEDVKKRWYYLLYTIVFCCLACCCFSWFLLSNRSLIWQMDGWSQHFKALVYYSTYLREILQNLVYEHSLIIPDWDFYIGEGGDILNALHYYVIGIRLRYSLFWYRSGICIISTRFHAS